MINFDIWIEETDLGDRVIVTSDNTTVEDDYLLSLLPFEIKDYELKLLS